MGTDKTNNRHENYDSLGECVSEVIAKSNDAAIIDDNVGLMMRKH